MVSATRGSVTLLVTLNDFVDMFQNRVKDCAMQQLQHKINNTSKLLHYRHFKTLLNPERYLSMDLPYLYKKAWSNFRCSGHKFNVEVGRQNNIDRENRYCEHCLRSNIHVVEDEFHVMLICPTYLCLRKDCFP